MILAASLQTRRVIYSWLQLGFLVICVQCHLQEATVFEPVKASDFKFSSGSGNHTMSRTVVKSVLSVEQDEGLGARVRRSVGRAEVGHVSQSRLISWPS